MFLSCKKEAIETTNSSSLRVNVDSVLLSSQVGQVDSISINYNDQWSLTVNPTTANWFKTNIKAGTGNAKVYLTVLESNTTDTTRQATINITFKGDPTVLMVRIKQKGKQWQQTANFPGVARYGATSFVIGNKFYVGSGIGHKDNILQQLADFFEYDAVSNTWKQISDLPGKPRENAMGFALNGKGYLAFGVKIDCPTVNVPCSFTYLKDFWEYDPSTNKWKEVGNFEDLGRNGNATSVFTINNKAYLWGSQKLWEFSPIDYTLKLKTENATTGLVYSSTFSINGKGYVGTGLGAEKAFFEYDPAINKWSKKKDFGGEERINSIGFSLNGKGYIGGGTVTRKISQNSSQSFPINDLWEYDPQMDEWKQVGNIPYSTPVLAVAGVVAGKVIVGTGLNYPTPSFGKEFWIY